MTSKDTVDQADNRVYELGFHLVASIPEEKLSAEFSTIKEVIEGKGGSFVSEEFPKLRALSYQMTKVIGPKHLKFDTAYFGWVKFEIQPESISDIKKVLDLNDNILRFLIVKTVKENTMSVAKPPVFRGEVKPIGTGEIPKNKENKAPVSEAELDKTIDALVVE